MKSKDRNESSGEKPSDDSEQRKRKQRIPKKGYTPPPFEPFAEADRSRPKRGGFGASKPGSRKPFDRSDRHDRPDRADRPARPDRPARKPFDGPKREFSGDKPAFGDRPKRNFGDKPAFGDRPKRNFGDKPAFGDRPKRNFNRDDSRGAEEPRRKFGRGGVPTEGVDNTFPPRKRSFDGDKPAFGDRPKRSYGGDKPAFGDRPKRSYGGDKPAFGERPKRSYGGDKPAFGDRPPRKSARDSFKGYGPKGFKGRDKEEPRPARAEAKAKPEEVRLNKYIAHSGVCARREADALIESGNVKVNGKVVTELGTKVMTTDKVMVNDMVIQFEPFKYVLMNKPKNTITTTSDEKGRKTVMDIIENEIGERLYPVGRLDRNTTGVLLLTNDGDLANRLMHPSYTVGKVYQAEINRVLTDEELDQLRLGVELEDGPAKAYHVVRGTMDPYSIELAVHEGRNHLVRRMVEALGAEVVKLKRSQFAGLNLEDLRQGRWRFLKTREVNTLRTKVKLPELRK